MPNANRISIPVAVDEMEIEGRNAKMGEYTVGFDTYRQQNLARSGASI